MATVPSYIPLRDDAGIKSISKNERDFIRKCALNEDRILRLDGRTSQQSRPTRLVLTRYPNGASGATLQWGTGTRVAASCTGEVVPPVDRPNEGIVNISVELSPSASTAFRQVPPVSNMGAATGNRGAGSADEAQKLETNRILRALERLMASCLDAEALVVSPGQWVWKLSLSVVVLDAAAGNLMDACWMATLAALQHYRQPHTEARNSEDDNKNNPLAPVLVSLDAKEGTPLPLHQVPFSVSFALIADETDSSKRKVVFLQDPSQQEEMIAAGLFTYALNVHQEVTLVDFAGGAEINLLLIREVHEAAAKQVGILAKALQVTLAQADEQAVEQRLRTLKQQSNIPTTADQAPDAEDNMDLPPLPDGDVRSPDDLQAEEEYRKQALDYNLGHVAQPIADDDRRKKGSKGTSALLASLLQTASQAQQESNQDEKPAAMEVEATTQPPPEDFEEAVSRAKVSTNMDLDSDDEEATTMQLQSEFTAAKDPSPPTQVPKLPSQTINHDDDDDDDVDDLAAAIKTKKKKKKKK
eukprot:scaffold3403_cov158-Amphora_coffeaeformis.AAC.10